MRRQRLILLICGAGRRIRREVLLLGERREGNREDRRGTQRGGMQGIREVLGYTVSLVSRKMEWGKYTSSASELRDTRCRCSGEARERRGRSSSNAGRRTSQRDGSGRTSSSGSRDTGSGSECRSHASSGRLAEAGAGVGRRRGLDRNRNELRAAKDDQAECALLLLLDRLGGGSTGRGSLGLLALVLTEFLRVGKNEIHMLFDLLAKDRYVSEKGKREHQPYRKRASDRPSGGRRGE